MKIFVEVSIVRFLWYDVQHVKFVCQKQCRLFLWRHFPSSLWFLLLNLVGHIKRCLHKNIGNILWFSFGDMTVPFQKTMYRHCDLDPWPMKVKLFLSIDYDPISVLYQIQSDMSTNSRKIKYQNIEKSLSLIIEWLVSMATKKNPPFRFSRQIFAMVLGPECIGCQKVRTIGPVLRPVHRSITDKWRQTDKPRWPIYFAKFYDFAK